MKKVFCIVGAGLVVGAVVAVFYLLNNKKTKEGEASHDYKDVDGECESEDNESLTEVTIAQGEPIYEDVKSSAIGSMYSRHKGAAALRSNSIDEIRENIKVSENTNNEIDEISAELDEMICED